MGKTYQDTMPATGIHGRQYVPEKNPDAAKTQEKYRLSMASLLELNSLFDEFLIELQNASLPEETCEHFRQGFVKIPALLNPQNLGSTMEAFPAAELSLLELAASLMTRTGEASESSLQQIEKDIQRLQTIVREAVLDSSIKTILLELIRIAQDAIARYQIHGKNSLKKGFKMMIGELSDVHRLDETAQAQFKASEAWDAVMNLIKSTDVAANSVIDDKRAIDYFAPLLVTGPAQQNLGS